MSEWREWTATAKIKNKNLFDNVPISEVSIKKPTPTEIIEIDIARFDSSKIYKATLKDKLKVVASKSCVERDAEKVN